LTIFRSSEADRRSALKSSSRFWFFFRHKKEQEERTKRKGGKIQQHVCLSIQFLLLSNYS